MMDIIKFIFSRLLLGIVTVIIIGIIIKLCTMIPDVVFQIAGLILTGAAAVAFVGLIGAIVNAVFKELRDSPTKKLRPEYENLFTEAEWEARYRNSDHETRMQMIDERLEKET